jgi:hypothetical protein
MRIRYWFIGAVAALELIAFPLAAASASTRTGEENFTVADSNVTATGPVSFSYARDVRINGSRDVFVGRESSINLLHTPFPVPHVDYRACIVSISQTGQWEFSDGSGAYREATGSGSFRLRAQFNYPVRRGVCSVNKLTPEQIRDQLNNNGSRLPFPVFASFQMTGTGFARA